jgi:hypothetical protein
MKNYKITREIRQASSLTARGHVGCIFKATAEYKTSELEFLEFDFDGGGRGRLCLCFI